jgi:hypothetical protein
MKRAWTVSILALLLAAGAAAQEKQEAPKPGDALGVVPGLPGGRKSITPLRVQVVFKVPVPTQSKEGAPIVQYRNVGTNIDCSASSTDDGRYRLELVVEQSSIYSTPDEKGRSGVGGAERKPGAWDMAGTPMSDLPLFRTFNTVFKPLLRDGQTAPYTTATDPVSGEVVRIDETVNVVK